MEFILEEIDIKDEQETDDLGFDLDLGSSSQSLDWKLNPNVECRVMLERSLQTEKELQRYSDENVDNTTDTSSEDNWNVDKSCGVYRKLKLLVDVLKNCEKREKCELCEKFIQQLQQHLVLTHGNNTRDTQEENSIEIETTSVSEPTNLNRTVEQNVIHALDASNNSIRTDGDGKPFSQNEDSNKMKCQSMSKVGKSKPFKCETCGKGFLTFYDLTQHKSEHVDDTRDTVKTSEKLFQSSYDINQQEQSGTPNQNHHHMITRMRVHMDEKTHESDTRAKIYLPRKNLTMHKNVHADANSYKCVVCGKFFTNHSHFKRHKLVHTREKPFKCDVCGKRFAQNYILTEHELTHTGEKPHRCDKCGKNFAHNSSLGQHKLTHTGEKRYKCVVCNKAFTRYSSLTQHKLSHTGERPFKCDVCEKTFTRNCNLTVHKLRHTGVKLHECDVCGKTFTQYSHLTQHKLTHTREKRFGCVLCGKYFTQKSTLSRHIRTHTGEKPYKCEMCGKCFASQSNFRGHKLRHTR